MNKQLWVNPTYWYFENCAITYSWLSFGALSNGSFQEQVKREVSYREEISKQLELMRETLCSELDQERKARYAVLQKLKEAHDALHHFSCKVLIPRQCTDCAYRPILPQ